MSLRELDKDGVVAALRGVIDAHSGQDVVSLGMLRDLAVCDGNVRVVLQLPAGDDVTTRRDDLHEQTRTLLAGLPGVRSVDVEFQAPPLAAAGSLPGVKHVVAVGAGKGGVGKSTVALLLAVGLKRRGLRAGVLDADVYGPSIPKLTGTESAQPLMDDDGRVIPPRKHGISIMSMGYFVPPDQAVVWRGPMAQKYVKEFLDRGAWGELDYLIVDLPPGTGDIPLTLAQSIPLAGAVIVCTPQDVALLDAVKALRMYRKLGVDPIGMVENMSFYVCPQCGHRDDLFGHGGAQQAARELGVPFLGAIPLNIEIRKNGDAGEPLANFTAGDGHVADALEKLVARFVEETERRARQRTPLPQLRVRG
ncbi:MAG: Mrp/NBP35 family ATP-binding protein [Phycisphaerae bacterium]|jgi:ATP-binding protein involved in chromosome partitioning